MLADAWLPSPSHGWYDRLAIHCRRLGNHGPGFVACISTPKVSRCQYVVRIVLDTFWNIFAILRLCLDSFWCFFFFTAPVFPKLLRLAHISSSRIPFDGFFFIRRNTCPWIRDSADFCPRPCTGWMLNCKPIASDWRYQTDEFNLWIWAVLIFQRNDTRFHPFLVVCMVPVLLFFSFGLFCLTYINWP